MPKRRGQLITFEGTEGAGKSTLIQALARSLRRRGIACLVTREPGGSRVAENIRDIILHQNMHAWTELFLYEASRAEHLHETILPALDQGKWVLCDRFTDSTLAYQGAARGLPWKELQRINAIATQGLKPRWTVWIDIDPKRGLRNARNPNRFEAEGVRFQTRVRSGYARAMRENPKRWIKIPAYQGSPEEMAESLLQRMRIPRSRA